MRDRAHGERQRRLVHGAQRAVALPHRTRRRVRRRHAGVERSPVRDVFIERLSTLAEQDPRIMLITGDLGFGVLTKFEQRFPRQYINAGVAEQNMTGLATGLALEGRIVFTYSIGNFPTLRCLEQIRNDAAYHEANVNVVSVGGGFSYGALGVS